VDSKVVSRELWRVVRSPLKEAGWNSFTSRTARRFSDSTVDVINFQSFNSYLAAAIGSTTYSFSVRLGCFLCVVPDSIVKIKNGIPMPEEYHCHLRRTLLKKFHQPECPRADVFYIDPSGKYLQLVVEAVRQGIVEEGFDWFRRFSDMREVLRTLLADDETNDGTWGFGANPSPARSLYTGYVALSLGDTELAFNNLSKVASSSSFEQLRERIKSDLSQISLNR
jgi:hypothetical protein